MHDGKALDQDKQPELTQQRLRIWVALLTQEFARSGGKFHEALDECDRCYHNDTDSPN
ncbi:hypothetical protein [Fischerella thermalis]|uniref:hypothetical protein n=1 Tax=Fischerella thermalis TaxID=372787 RepID=UPI0015E0B0C8|nr:hypothetical protein [Fischerella thermalis]